MAEDHLLFLREKFMEDLKEAEEEFNEIPLLPHFQAISEVLTPCWITSSTTIEMKDSLYDLKFALAECVMLAEKEIDRRSQKRKIQVDAHFVKKHWFLFCTRRKLLHIRKKLLRLRRQCWVNPSLGSAIQSFAQPEAFVTDPPFDPSTIHGFDCHLHQIQELLFKEAPDSRSFKAIGIVGMGGSGKTALARLVFHSARVRKSFSPMLWVHANAHARPRHIASSIVGHLASFADYEEICLMEYDGLLEKMYHRLHNSRYLIVVDNLWHGSDDEMDPISSPYFCRGLPKGRGGAIIVTSRMKEEVRKMVGGDSPDLHLIEPVLDRESWFSIVMESIPVLDCSDPTHILIRDEIAERYDGLPFAAKTLAKIVSAKLGFWANISRLIGGFILKLDVPDHEEGSKAMTIVSRFSGVTAVEMVMTEKMLIVYGTVDPEIVVSKLRKFWPAHIFMVVQPEEPEKKEEQKKDEAKKEEEKKKGGGRGGGGGEEEEEEEEEEGKNSWRTRNGDYKLRVIRT